MTLHISLDELVDEAVLIAQSFNEAVVTEDGFVIEKALRPHLQMAHQMMLRHQISIKDIFNQPLLGLDRRD